ncbi:helix-turn-helix protein [Haloactinospora alba]|uniref:Helix-turn-helix protein n=1 Tax=Haloactinospora alba TaxID=405555 RepID=A0A543NET6_9ACTN|nr:helix-turn-helix transcriptional regulator [Haloactinospora alba]TQN30331.1 helix-turn-helix protein [Haloactinospora alba]
MGRRYNPTWQKFGSELRKHRTSTSMSQGQVAQALVVSSSLISYMESGMRGPQFDQAQQLDALFRTTGTFERLWKSANGQTLYPTGSRTSIDFEQLAYEIREYHNFLVPGLMQTADYARATFAAMRPFVDAATIDQLVDSRLQRQRVLEDTDRPLMWVVLDETVIRRNIGGVVTMKGQIGHLLRLIDEHVLRLQIVPSDLSMPPGLCGPFRVFAFADRPMVVTAEHVVDDVVLDSDEHVRTCSTLWSAIQADALPTSSSVDLLRQIQGELDE